MLKDYAVFQCLLNEKGFPHASSAIYGNEFRPVASVESFQLFYLLSSANYCTHNGIIILKSAAKIQKCCVSAKYLILPIVAVFNILRQDMMHFA